jgi:hypothetical protein
MYHHAMPGLLIEIVLLPFFGVSLLALNHDQLNLHHLSNWDYRREPVILNYLRLFNT